MDGRTPAHSQAFRVGFLRPSAFISEMVVALPDLSTSWAGVKIWVIGCKGA